MRRYVKRATAVLAAALVCASLMGGGVFAENGNESDVKDGRAIESVESGEDGPDIPTDKELVEDGKPAEDEGQAEGGIIPLSAGDCPVKIDMDPPSLGEEWAETVTTGDKIGYYARVTNTSDDAIKNVVIKFILDDSVSPDMANAKYSTNISNSDTDKKLISGSSDYAIRQEGNEVIFTANSLERGSFVKCHLDCEVLSEEADKLISSKANVVSVNGVTYSGVESASTLHKVYVETAPFTLKTNINSNNQYVDYSKVFTYNFNFIKGTQGLTTSLPYVLKDYSGTTVKEGTLEVKNGSATVSFPAKNTFEIAGMRTGISYTVTRKDDTNYTWDKESAQGTTSTGSTNIMFNATYKYVPVKYPLDTNIVVNMQGREFKAGDAFLFSIAPENEGDPVFNQFPLPSGDSDEIAYFTDEARIKPSSGTTATLPLEEKQERVSCLKCNACGVYTLEIKEMMEHSDVVGCYGGWSSAITTLNVRPVVRFLYPGTYNYIIHQSTMESDDYDNIRKDTTQYRVTVKVTASGADLSATIASVTNTTTGERLSDTSKLEFTNYFGVDNVMKGDVNQNSIIDMGDVILCLRHVSKNGQPLTGRALIAANVDGNESVNMGDVLRILNYVSKKSPAL